MAAIARFVRAAEGLTVADSGGDPAVAGDPHRFVELLRERLLALAAEEPAPAWE